jgi:hypothetical protein
VEPTVTVEDVELGASAHGLGSTCRAPIGREAPERLELSLSEAALVEGGGNTVEVSVVVLYPGRRPPMPIDPPTLRADLGTVSEPEPDGGGGFSARWTLPASFADRRSATLRASLAGEPEISATGSLVLERPPPPARPPIHVGARIGFLTNFGKINAPYAVGAFTFALDLGEAGALLLGAQAGFWAGWDSRLDRSETEQVDLQVWAIPLLGRVGYRLEVGDVDLFAHLEGGAVVARTELSSESTGVNAQILATWALGGSLGAGLRLGPGVLLLEVGYLHSPVEGRVEGNVGGLHVAAGYDFEL